MSDNTPTQRFDQASGDAPTERFDGVVTPPPRAPDAPPGGAGEGKGSRRLLVTLIVVGVALLLAILIVLFVLLARGNGATVIPSASASMTPNTAPSMAPSPTPSVTPTSTTTATKSAVPPPAPTTLAITSFTAKLTAQCDSKTGNPVYLKVAWASKNGIAAYFGVNTADAETGGQGWTLPPSGNQNDFPSGYVPFVFPCGNTSQNYTITIVGNGTKQSKTVKVVNTGDVY